MISSGGIRTLVALLLLVLFCPPPARAEKRWGVVRPGDTLADLAARYHVATAELSELNPDAIDPSRQLLAPGTTVVRLPEARLDFSAPASSQVEEEFFEYWRVEAGQTAESLAVKFDTTVQALGIMNPGMAAAPAAGSIIFVPNPRYAPSDPQAAYLWEKLRGRAYPHPLPPGYAADWPKEALVQVALPQSLAARPIAPAPERSTQAQQELDLLVRYALTGQLPPHAAGQMSWAAELARLPEARTLRRVALASRRGNTIYRLLKQARSLVGIPYVWGGESPSGADCSGYVQLVFARLGILVPRTADIQFEVGAVVPKGLEQPGDLVFFETYTAGASHVGIYAGSGRFLHASSSAGRVTFGSLEDPYFKARYLGARRNL